MLNMPFRSWALTIEDAQIIRIATKIKTFFTNASLLK